MYEIMSKPVIGVDPQMDVRYCIKLFDRFGLSRAPVIKKGKIIGLVSYTDIVLKGVINAGLINGCHSRKRRPQEKHSQKAGLFGR